MNNNIKNTLSSLQLSLLYYLISSTSSNKEFIDALEISDDDLNFLIKNKLIEEVVEEDRYVITQKGVKSIKNKHTVVHSIGEPYVDVFNTCTSTAAIKMSYVMVEENFFKKLESKIAQNQIISSMLKNNFFKRINDVKIYNNILYELFFYNSTDVNYSLLLSYYEIFKARVKYLIEKKCQELKNYSNEIVNITDGKIYGIDDYDIEALINIYNSIKQISSDNSVLLNSTE